MYMRSTDCWILDSEYIPNAQFLPLSKLMLANIIFRLLPSMVEFNPILRKAYWLLAASGLIYVSIVCSLTFPEVQRLYVTSFMRNSFLSIEYIAVSN